jgi:hypothetical protein
VGFVFRQSLASYWYLITVKICCPLRKVLARVAMAVPLSGTPGLNLVSFLVLPGFNLVLLHFKPGSGLVSASNLPGFDLAFLIAHQALAWFCVTVYQVAAWFN